MIYVCMCVCVCRLGLNVKDMFHRLVRVLLHKYTLTSAILSKPPPSHFAAGFIFPLRNLQHLIILCFKMYLGQNSQGRLRYTCESTSENSNDDDDIIEFSDLNPLRTRVRSSKNRSSASMRDNLTLSLDEEPLSPSQHMQMARNGFSPVNLTGFQKDEEVPITLNIALSGSAGVGKSTLLSRFCSNLVTNIAPVCHLVIALHNSRLFRAGRTGPELQRRIHTDLRGGIQILG